MARSYKINSGISAVPAPSVPLRWLVLDSNHADYAAAIAAIPKIYDTSGAVHDSSIKVVQCRISDTRTGDLAPVAVANLGVGVFQDEYADAADFEFRGHGLLGASIQTHYYIRNNWAQASQGDTPTAVTLGGSGKTFGDAVAWEEFDALTPDTTDIVVWIVGDHIPVLNSGWVTADLSLTMESGATDARRNQYRFDYPGHRGCMWGGALLGSHVTWVDDGETPGPGNGHIWSMAIPFSSVGNGWFLDPGVPIANEFSRSLVRRSTEADMQDNVNTNWAANYNSGTTIKLHLPNGENPTNRVLAPTITTNKKQFALLPLNFETNPPKVFVDFYECKRRAIADRGQWRLSGAKFLRGRNSEVGMDVDAGSGGSGSSEAIFLDLDNAARWGTDQTYIGWRIEGFRCRRSRLGLLFNLQTATSGNTMDTGWYLADIDGEDIGGHDINHDSSDGMVVGFQGAAKNIQIRGSLRCVNTGGPMQFYAFSQNDTDPAQVSDQSFSGLDIDCNPVDMQGHAEFSTIAGTINDVGIHMGGDADIAGDFSNISIKLTGTIKDFERQIRAKYGHQVVIDSHTNGGLILAKGASGEADVHGIFCQVAADIHTVTLSSSSGNWNVGDILADPGTPANAHAIITKVIDANPTVTLQYKGGVGAGSAPWFSDTETVANLDDTGTGTANGAGSFVGDLAGNVKVTNVRFESDLDTFYEHAGTDNPDGNAADGSAVGFHVQANNNIYVGSTATFDSLHGAAQTFAQWQANSASDNQYDPDSTNPAS